MFKLRPLPPPTPRKKPLSITGPVLKYVSKVKADVPKLIPGERESFEEAEPNWRAFSAAAIARTLSVRAAAASAAVLRVVTVIAVLDSLKPIAFWARIRTAYD